MKLSKLRVRKFRNIIDTGNIDVDEAVTCLVGMNESGKTAVLSALHRLNPIDNERFDEKRDYLRWLLSKDRRENIVNESVPISATFALEEDEVERIKKVVGTGVLSIDEVTVSRKYNTDTVSWAISTDAQ